jgi:hypothetical protein
VGPFQHSLSLALRFGSYTVSGMQGQVLNLADVVGLTFLMWGG